MKILPIALFFAVLVWTVAADAQTAVSTATAQAVWARATPPGATTGAIYLTLVNPGPRDDRLVGGATPVAGSVQFHSETNDGGIMKMQPLDGIDVPPGATVVLKPSNTHLMLLKLQKRLLEGQTFPLTLTFEKAGTVSVEVRVGTVGQMTDPAVAKRAQ